MENAWYSGRGGGTCLQFAQSQKNPIYRFYEKPLNLSLHFLAGQKVLDFHETMPKASRRY